MIIFLDENDVEYGALATIKATNAVNGERSITGEIISGDVVLSRIERGWRLRFEDEYYVVTFAKPIDEGKNVQVSFDAVHQFFWDFGKSSVYDQLSDGSHTFRAYLDFIFNGSGYKYDIESSLTVKAFEKQSFGYKNRLSLFNDIITSSGVEFQVNGKVVRILAKVGTDLSTVVRKNFNLNELGIEKNIGNFVTYQKGFGAYFDEEDHSKGRLIAEYTSPLASVYGKLEADPLVDERYKQSESLLSALKETVDNSYTISVSLDMEDLTRAGYRYTQPVAGDYIMAINETLGFKEKIRIVSFTSEYDVAGQLIKHTVTCNDIGSVKKLSASYTQTQHQAANAEVNANTAYEFANKALVSANGKNTNYYGDTFPVDNPKGTLKKGDLLFLTVGDTVKQYYWNGAEWVTNPVVSDVEAFKEQIAEELKDVPNREEFENKISEEIANSKAEIGTQIETAKTQAESNAKEYADTINQETAKVAELANAAADEIKADLVNVKNNLTSTSIVANNAQAAVDEAKQELTKVNAKVDSAKAELTQTKQDLTEVASDLNTAKQDLANSVTAVNTKVDSTKAELTQAKQDLMSHAQQLQTQANAQTELSKRVTTVETTANGTKTTVNELTKTVSQNGKDITSVTNRTKIVEDDLANTKTTLTQVQTTADSASQKTATLETGLNGLSSKFEKIEGKLGGLLTNRPGNWQNKYVVISGASEGSFLQQNSTTRISPKEFIAVEAGKEYTVSLKELTNVDYYFKVTMSTVAAYGVANSMLNKDEWIYSESYTFTAPENCKYVMISVGCDADITPDDLNTKFNINLIDWISIETKLAEYKQTADQNYASLQTTVQNLDGTVQHNKTVADQTAQGFTTRIETLETYKSGESTRANQYFELAKTETARQLSVERTAIAKDYVAKSTYTSDVTGIRNELTATTTTANTIKTNLANYQATNDKVVANLQSNMQTANGDISSLKTKVEAVPGQITSAVSAVESKIPTSVGGANYLTNISSNWQNKYVVSGAATGSFNQQSSTTRISPKDFIKVEAGKEYTVSLKELTNVDYYFKVTMSTVDSYGVANSMLNKDEWIYSNRYTFTAPENCKYIMISVGCDTGVTPDDLNTKFNIKLERGNIATDWSPAPEDTVSQISSLSSQIQQTADGMTLLATKTELNSAKTEMQSGISTATNKANNAQTTANNNAQTISTHTTQISALNTGLSAKVSQTDFNTLSGRVTTAENNITAKANELSSKITSVEGKIPTSSGGRNLALGTSSEWSTPYTYFHGGINHIINIAKVLTSGLKVGDTLRLRVEVKYDNIVPAEGKTAKIVMQGPGNVTGWGAGGLPAYGDGPHVISGSGETTFDVKDKIFAEHLQNDFWNWAFRIDYVTSGSVQFRLAKAEAGDLPTPWSPAPEDTVDQISSLSSQIKQTADGMTLLATKTELNTAKSDLQSGISTATSKADNAQATANSNAQTIITHTTQISALNTGLSAKVSQTDFNTLSGRVTTAENNITAKANELSSKITSVEGKIPTSSGGRNLAQGTSKDWSNPYTWFSGVKNTCINLYKVITDGLAVGDTFKTRIVLKYTNIVPASGQTAEIWIQGAGNVTDWNSGAYPSGGSGRRSLSGSGEIVFELTDKIIADHLKNDYWSWHFRTDYIASGSLQWKLAKVERGMFFTDWSPAPEDYDSKLATAQSEIKQTTDSIKASVQSLDNSTVKNSSLTINTDGVVIKAGKSTSDFANAVGSYFSVNQNAINLFSDKINVKGNMIVSGAITSDKIASQQINTAHLNGKIITADVISSNAVTADAIKAGAVTTDKMSANSINGDRITAGTLDAAKIKAGSISASQIASGTLTSEQIKAGAIKSINIEASAITSDKIASNSIDASKIVTNGLTANIIKGGKLQSLSNATNFELDTGKLFYNHNNTGVFRVQSGASTMGLKFTNTAITVNGSSKVLSRVILGGDRRESTLDDGKWDQGGFTGIVAETINGVASNAHDKADTLRAIGDNIYFTHSYETDALTGVSAAGWKMETYAPDTSYKGNVVLKPYGVSYRQSNIVVGDLRLDNGDGSGYWMRATINVLKACFGHIVNGGISSDALNAIKSELNKISGT